MQQKVKCLEYYMDSRIYTSKQVQENIDETKKQFPDKKTKVTLALNDFGVYVINFKFENKNNYWDKIKIRLKSRLEKMPKINTSIGMKDYSKPKVYGQYKQTKTYKPY